MLSTRHTSRSSRESRFTLSGIELLSVTRRDEAAGPSRDVVAALRHKIYTRQHRREERSPWTLSTIRGALDTAAAPHRRPCLGHHMEASPDGFSVTAFHQRAASGLRS